MDRFMAHAMSLTAPDLVPEQPQLHHIFLSSGEKKNEGWQAHPMSLANGKLMRVARLGLGEGSWPRVAITTS